MPSTFLNSRNYLRNLRCVTLQWYLVFDKKLIQDPEYLVFSGTKRPWVCSNWSCVSQHIKACSHSSPWYSIRLNLDKVCMSDPERESTRCLISVQPVSEMPARSTKGPWRFPAATLPQWPTYRQLRRSSAIQTSPWLPLSFPPLLPFCGIHVIAVYFSPSPANKESPAYL